MVFLLADHNIEGHAEILVGMLTQTGTTEALTVGLLRFSDIGLDIRSTDRTLWRSAQQLDALLITNNRNAEDRDSLTLTIAEEGTINSLPVLTIGNPGRLSERPYLQRCAARIGEILLELDAFRGAGRIFIP